MIIFCKMFHLQAMNMSFKRNDVQEYIEAALHCSNIEQWPSYKSTLEQWEIDASNIVDIQRCAKSDICSYFLKAYQSFVQALHEIDNKKYAWSIVKLYYSIFYLLRCEILLSNHIIIRCKTLYYTKIKIGERPIAFNPNKFKGDHQLTIALEEKLYNSRELSDPILGNKIDDENVYMWFMKHRDRVNYQMKDFSDPCCDPVLTHIISYFDRKELVRLFEFYNSNNDYSICFDVEHMILAVPYKKLISVYKRIRTGMVITSDIRNKIIETNKLLCNMGVLKKDIVNLIL